MERVLLQVWLEVYSTMSQPMVEVQKLSSILEAKLCTKIRAKWWQAFMKKLNFLDRQVWANSVEAIYRSNLIRVYTLCHSVCIFLNMLNNIVKYIRTITGPAFLGYFFFFFFWFLHSTWEQGKAWVTFRTTMATGFVWSQGIYIKKLE